MGTQFNGKGWRASNPSRQLDGLSQPSIRSLQDMTSSELTELHDKTNTMLNNSSLKLPDGGAKLKAKLEQIEELLKSESRVTNSITDKVSGLSLNDKLDVRKETVLRSNNEQQPSRLLRAHHEFEQQPTRAARMMSLEESMKLQESQENDIKRANMKKRMESIRNSAQPQIDSLADDLTLAVHNLQLDSETRVPRPADDGESDGEGSDEDSDDDDLQLYHRYEDEGFEEEDDSDDQQEFEDGQVHNNNRRD